MEWRNPRSSSSGASVPPPNPRRTLANPGVAMNSNNQHSAQQNWARSSAALLQHTALSQANLHREKARLDSGVSKDLHDLLDELAKLNYPLDGIEPLSPPQVLLASAQIMYLSDDLLVTKAADVVFVICAKQKPDFSTPQGRSILEKLLETFLDSLSTTKQHVKIDLLRALSAVVFENGIHCQPFHPRLLDSLLPLASLSQPSIEIRRMAINSLGNLCTKAGKVLSAAQLDVVFKTLVRNLDLKESGKSALESQAEKRVVSSTFRSLQFVVAEKKSLTAEQIESLLESSKKHILPDKKPSPQNPEADSSRSSLQSKSGGFPPRRARGQSDSDFSDGSDSGFGGGSQQVNEMKAKQNALLCIQHAVKAAQKHAFGLWADYIPDSPNPKKASLFSLMKDSPSPKLRSAAAGTFCSFIEGSKQYLSMADDSGTAGTFLSLSRKLGNTVSLMHQELLEALANETDPTNVALLLKVLSVLVTNCAYQKLKGQYLSPIVMTLIPRLHHSELIIRTASLSTLEGIFSVTPALNELRLGLQNSFIPQNHRSKDKQPAPSPPQTLWTLATSDPSPQIRSGSMDCLAAIFRVYGNLDETWDALLRRLTDLLRDRDPLVRTSATKLLCDFARSLRDSMKHQECALLIQALIKDKVISSLVTDPHHGPRIAVTEVSSLLTDELFAIMNEADFREAACLPYLLVKDETPSVRVAATKALGIVCLLSIYKEDLAFVEKFTQTLRPRLLADQNVNVRVWASWALANLCDSLVLLKKSWQSGALPAVLGHEVLSSLASLVLEASEENEKLRTNCVRCVGDLLRCLENGTDQKLLQALIDFINLSMASSNAKIKWNACHASGNSFHNHVVLEHPASARCFEKLVSALSEEPLNFKVRINAVSAMMIPSRRDHYGPMLVVAFRAIQEALLGLDGINFNGFVDGKYKMQYEYKLQLCLLHLCSLLTDDDAGSLRSCLQDAPFFAALMAAVQKHSDLPPKAEKGGNLPIQAGPDPGASLLLSSEDREGDENSAISRTSLLQLGARNLLDLNSKLNFFVGSEPAASLLTPFATEASPEGLEQ